MTLDTRPSTPSSGAAIGGATDRPAPLPHPATWRYRAAQALRRLKKAIEPIWADWRFGVGSAIGLASAWGLVAGLATPRGPLTAAEALWSIALSLVVGAAGGFTSRSRWATLVSPAAFAMAFELVRSVEGPTVDGFHASAYGILAFVVGRGFHALVSLVPMALGAAVGAGTARNLSDLGNTRSSWLGRATAVTVAVGLAALSAGIARPPSTAPIVDAAGNQIAGSIAELTTIDSNGHELSMMIRGHSLDNPVLLFLAGGPGGSELGAMRNHLPELEEHFTVVTWDQRGTGKSYPELDPAGSMTLDSSVSDTIAVTNHLRDRFDQDRIYLLGQSWGSTLGVLAVQERPELYQAFIGAGQMVSQRETDLIFYEDTLVWAMATGQTDLFTQLIDIGPPPYDEMFPYETALSYEHEIYPYDHAGNSEGEGGFSDNFLVPEYTLIEQVHLLGAFMDTFAALYPQLQGIDFRENVTEFEVPVFFVQGAHEARGRSDLFEDWYPMIKAPTKELTVLPTSGHRPLWEQPEEFVDFMVNTVLVQATSEETEGRR